MATATMIRNASAAQRGFILKLAGERNITDLPDLAALDVREASRLIDQLKATPRMTPEGPRGGKPAAGPGVYRKDGKVYVVKATRDTRKLPVEQQRCYAMELVELPGRATRLTEADTEIPFELEIRRGFVYELAEADRMPLADAEQLMVRYAKCIVCGHGLRKADSVRRGIGPVCAGYFRE